MAESNFKIELNEQEIQVLITALAKEPYYVSVGVIEKINTQMLNQIEK